MGRPHKAFCSSSLSPETDVSPAVHPSGSDEAPRAGLSSSAGVFGEGPAPSSAPCEASSAAGVAASSSAEAASRSPCMDPRSTRLSKLLVSSNTIRGGRDRGELAPCLLLILGPSLSSSSPKQKKTRSSPRGPRLDKRVNPPVIPRRQPGYLVTLLASGPWLCVPISRRVCLCHPLLVKVEVLAAFPLYCAFTRLSIGRWYYPSCRICPRIDQLR